MKEITCIICPKGCRMKVIDENGTYVIKGHGCKRGLNYANQELTNPIRSIQTTIQTIFGNYPRLPVKSDTPIPLEKMGEVIDVCHHFLLKYKVKTGDIIIENVCETGVNIIATSDLYLRTMLVE